MQTTHSNIVLPTFPQWEQLGFLSQLDILERTAPVAVLILQFNEPERVGGPEFLYSVHIALQVMHDFLEQPYSPDDWTHAHGAVWEALLELHSIPATPSVCSYHFYFQLYTLGQRILTGTHKFHKLTIVHMHATEDEYNADPDMVAKAKAKFLADNPSLTGGEVRIIDGEPMYHYAEGTTSKPDSSTFH